jgi:hypothetical protein
MERRFSVFKSITVSIDVRCHVCKILRFKKHFFLFSSNIFMSVAAVRELVFPWNSASLSDDFSPGSCVIHLLTLGVMGKLNFNYILQKYCAKCSILFNSNFDARSLSSMW